MTGAVDPRTLPMDKVGFRLRGIEIRMETFTDAAFAFAVTLLAVSIDSVPTSYTELTQALLGIPAFALSFVILMIFWHGHWEWSRRYGLEDGPTIVLSCALVFVVLGYVYPLKFLFTLSVASLSGGRVANTSLGLESLEQLYGTFAIYGVGFVAMAPTLVGLYAHAYRRREQHRLDALERLETRSGMGAWLLLTAVGTLSVGLALLTPPSRLALPGWVYMLLPLQMPLYAHRNKRARERLGDHDRKGD